MSAHLTPMQWMVRAEEARLDAAAMHDPHARRMLLFTAASYERMAAHATSLEQSGLPYEVPPANVQLRGFRGTPRSW